MLEKLKKILRGRAFIIGAAAVAIYTLTGFFLAPALIRHYLPKTLRENLHKEVEVGRVRFNPYLFQLELNAFRMVEADGAPIIAFERLFVDWELKSLFKWAWLFREVRLETPAVQAVISKEGGLNLAGLGSPSKDQPPAQPMQAPPPRLIFENIQILNGQLTFTDQRPSRPATLTLAPVSLLFGSLSTLPARQGTVAITAMSPTDETVTWEGRIGLNPVAIQGHFDVRHVRAATLAAFAGDGLNLAPPTGTLAVEGDCLVDLGRDATCLELSKLSLLLEGIALALPNAPKPFLELPEVRLGGAKLDLTGRTLDLGAIAVKGGSARLAVDEKGVLNLQDIVLPPEKKPAKTAPEVREQQGDPSWNVLLGEFTLDGFGALYEDRRRAPGLKAAVGAIKARLAAEAHTGKTWSALVKDAALEVKDVRAGAADAEPVVRIGAVTLEKGKVDLGKRHLTAARIAIEGGDILVERRLEGRINLASLFAPAPAEVAAEQPLAVEEKPAADKTPAFQFLVDRVAIAGIQATVWDRLVRDDQPILTVDALSADASQVDGRSPMPVELSLGIREGGQIKAAGTLDPAAGSLTAKIEVTSLALATFQPYIASVARVILKSGAFSTTGTLRHAIPAAGAQTVYEGGFNVENLQVVETDIDETVIGWKLAATEQLKLLAQPNALEIGDLRVQDLSGKVIIENDGSFNLANLFKAEAFGQTDPSKRTPVEPAQAAQPFAYRVRRVLINDGRITFADRRLRIPFDTNIHELRGNIAGITSVKDARSELRLRGRVDEFGTARAEGEINTADPKMFTNIKVAFRNLEMSTLTPYSGQFAGRTIDAGKLTVDLAYDIDNGQLKGDNKIVVEQLKLGEKVESPDAVNLPLDLAVALLKDSKGVIDLGLPVQGDLNNPQFSFGALIGKTLLNVLKKIATSPFRALGALIPGGDEATLDQVAFDPGRAKVPPPEKEKLLKLAEAMRQRPQIKLVVQGRYHPEKDRQFLARRSLRKTVTIRLGQTVSSDDSPNPLDFSSSETRDALEEMFEERFGEDALEAFEDEMKAARKEGRAADAGSYAKELFARLLAVESIPDERLVELAQARAQAVTAELSAQGLPAERFGTREPVALEAAAESVTIALGMEAR
ncbi:MAG: DUF748 domain-containing protein [Desulfobacterales bacterium]|nr:DUF748 domain-containing protein [Desulfobacterales bacterium]